MAGTEGWPAMRLGHYIRHQTQVQVDVCLEIGTRGAFAETERAPWQTGQLHPTANPQTQKASPDLSLLGVFLPLSFLLCCLGSKVVFPGGCGVLSRSFVLLRSW